VKLRKLTEKKTIEDIQGASISLTKLINEQKSSKTMGRKSKSGNRISTKKIYLNQELPN